jgi:hypothetical protein
MGKDTWFSGEGTTAGAPFWRVRVVLVPRVRDVVLETLRFESIEDHAQWHIPSAESDHAHRPNMNHCPMDRHVAFVL